MEPPSDAQEQPPPPAEVADDAPSETEETLDTEGKIELNAFLERKGWIEDKCALLESMPPIEVFAGLEQLLSDDENVPSALPTRKQLAEWLAEHDAIEKETEQFDSGDMIRLKKFAKAATGKHLSPEDTDLIEVTLNTLLGLDKLLHLLRARSDTLDLLGLRLTWEEQRIGAWKEKRKITDDLRAFLVSRGRWSPAAYDALAASIANGSASGGSTDIAVLNRSARYKHTEMLSHDAAQFAGRVIALRNAYVNPAGKTLDKLIEASTKGPVPDEILDEQDRVEDRCTNELEGMGKFAINTVMQWKRADELYGELKKDQLTAEALESEIRNALLGRPTLKHDVAFSSRSQALLRRLQLIGDPKSNISSFPRPVHPLFPDQQTANDSVTSLLSDELQKALRLARSAEAKVRQYHTSLVAVQRVEAARSKMVQVTSQLTELTKFFTDGDTSQADGAPPDLSTPACLQPVAHSAFLAMLPSKASRMPSLETAAGKALHETESSLMTLPSRGIDSQFRADTSAEKEQLIQARINAVQAKTRATALVTDLKAARGVWSAIADVASDLDSIQDDIVAGLHRQRFRGQLSSNGAPLTPESPNIALPPARHGSTDIRARLQTVRQRIDGEVLAALRNVSPRLPDGLAGHLETTARLLGEMASGMHSLVSTWDAVVRQADAMRTIHDEVNALESGIESAKAQMSSAEAEMLGGSSDAARLRDIEDRQESLLNEQRQLVQTFLDGLAARIPLVNRSDAAAASLAKALASSDDNSVPRSRPRRVSVASAPPDLAAIDSAVRSDANGLAINLSGSLHTLERARDRLKVAGLAKAVDAVLDPWTAQVQQLQQELSELNQTLVTLSSTEADGTSLARIVDIKDRVAVLSQTRRSEIGRSRSPVREAVQRLQTAASALGSIGQEDVVVHRVRAFEHAEQRLDAVDESMAKLRENVDRAHANEVERLRLLEEERLRREEEERLRREEAERLRLEEERLRMEEEERRRKEEEERLRREEEERLQREEEERLRLAEEERLRLAEEERLRVAEEERLRLAEAERLRLAEEERLRKEEEERLRLEKEERLRLEEEMRRKREEEDERAQLEEQERLKRVEEARLAEEARLHAEAEERARAEAALRQREEEDARRRADEERLQKEEEEAARMRQEEEDRLRAEERDQVVELSWDQQREIDDRMVVDHGEQEHEDEVESPDGVAFPPAVQSEFDALAQQAARLRTQLRALRIVEMSTPTPGSPLPSPEDVERILREFEGLEVDIVALLTAHRGVMEGEINYLRDDFDRSSSSMPRVQLLAKLAERVLLCDNALSDLLEHVDFFPVAPIKHLAATHRSDPSQTPQEQLSARISFTKQTLEDMQTDFNPVADDPRAANERDRVLQTWNELHEMSVDRLAGNRSRAPSVAESACSATSSRSRMGPPAQPRARTQSTISMSGRKPASAPLTTPRRTSKGTIDFMSRPSSKMSMRSVSGPLAGSSNSSLFSSTFSSRQRTTSLSSQTSNTPQRRRERSPVRPPSSAQVRRVASPSPSISSSRAGNSPRSTFARAPRFSLSSPAPVKPKRKPYVPNAKSKLDVAVGEVMNKLPEDMAIHMEPIGWQDNSGKYWIGDSDPKLCFCRILRSQTVMVRVGGGWMELSRFVKNHFANLYRLMPEPTPIARPSQEEKWISSSTLLNNIESPGEEGWRPPRTPEPRTPSHAPSFSLTTPSGTSPRSIPSSGGSPLTPLQFMRRAEEHLALPPPPMTPMKSPVKKPAPSVPSTPARGAVWRP